MFDYLISCRSVTTAQRCQRVLTRAGYKAYVIRMPAGVSREGCGFAVKLRGKGVTGAVRTLYEAGLPPRRIFRQDGEKFEEVVL